MSTTNVFHRYVALGDSQTEGLNDGNDDDGYRGWADRFAEHIAAANPDAEYANLAVRGKRTREVLLEQLPAALQLRPDLVSVVVGINDMLRPGADLAQVLADLDTIYATLADANITVVTTTFPSIAKIVPVAARLEPRLDVLNAAVRGATEKYGLRLIDVEHVEVMTDLRMWSSDRIHGSPLGHRALAAAAAEAVGLPGSDHAWAQPLDPPFARASGVRGQLAMLRWGGAFLIPWLWRRIRGKSSGDGRTAKRPELARVAVRAQIE